MGGRRLIKGGKVGMSGDTCPGPSTGSFLPGDSGCFWALAEKSALWVPGFRWGWCSEEGGREEKTKIKLLCAK